jgi:MFS family permease
LQPYLLELWGDPEAYSIAGLAAAIVAGSQIVGGILAPRVRRLVAKRTTVLIAAGVVGVCLLLALGFTTSFWVALAILTVWGVASSIDDPIRRAYLNDLIPSRQRATVLSFESLMGNIGGIGIQPVLGRVADVNGYAFSLVVGGVISAVAVPFMALSRKQHAAADTATSGEDAVESPTG